MVGLHHIPDWEFPVPSRHWAKVVLYDRCRRFKHGAFDHGMLD